MSRGSRALVLAAIMLVSIVVPASAKSGSITMAYWRNRYNSAQADRTVTTNIFVTNVSGEDVQVTITLYDQEGRPIGHPNFASVLSVAGGAINCNATKSVCTLPAGKHAQYWTTHSGVTMDAMGWGTVEWSQTGDGAVPVALAVDGHIAYHFTTGPMPHKMEFTRQQPF